jgi:hypothetical protein
MARGRKELPFSYRQFNEAAKTADEHDRHYWGPLSNYESLLCSVAQRTAYELFSGVDLRILRGHTYLQG